jgi:GNAT superfamily N-acetyltransferase
MALSLPKYLFDLQTLPGDLGRSWRADGFMGVRTEVRRRTLDRIALRARSLVIEGDLLDVREIPAPEGVVIREFTGDWNALGDLVGQRLASALSAASAAGRRSLVAWRDQRAVGIAWLAPGMNLQHDRFTLPLPPDAIYLWAVQVHRDERNRRVGRALGSAALRWAREMGWSRAWMIVRPDNQPSLHAVAGLMPSSRVLGSVTRTKLLARMTSHYEVFPRPLPIADVLCL